VIARKQVKLGERNRPFAARTAQPHDRVERNEGHAHVRGVRRDAAFAGPEHRMDAVIAVEGRAAGSGFALVAGGRRVAEVVTAGPLQQVSPGCRHIADLRRCAGEDRPREQRITRPDQLVVRHVAVADHRADAHAAVGERLDAGQRQRIDVDEDGRPLDVELHQVDERRAAGKITAPRTGRRVSRVLFVER
jgi:hypothetical protein